MLLFNLKAFVASRSRSDCEVFISKTFVLQTANRTHVAWSCLPQLHSKHALQPQSFSRSLVLENIFLKQLPYYMLDGEVCLTFFPNFRWTLMKSNSVSAGPLTPCLSDFPFVWQMTVVLPRRTPSSGCCPSSAWGPSPSSKKTPSAR